MITLDNIYTSFTNLGFFTQVDGHNAYTGLQSPSHYLTLFKTAIESSSCLYDESNSKLYVPWSDAKLYIEIDLKTVSVKAVLKDDLKTIGID